jgi:hypothetical protein
MPSRWKRRAAFRLASPSGVMNTRTTRRSSLGRSRRIRPACSILSKGIVHCFRNLTNEPVRMILTFTPAGIERFFEETLERAYDLTLQCPDNLAEVGARYAEAAPRYGMEFFLDAGASRHPTAHDVRPAQAGMSSGSLAIRPPMTAARLQCRAELARSLPRQPSCGLARRSVRPRLR